VQRFLSALRDDLGWDWTRVFLFGFSQGAAVAFHLSMTTREPLGGVVLVAGGVLAGSHTASYTFKQHGGEAEATPMLLIAGAEDDEYPQSLVRESRRQFAAAFPSNAGAFECEVIPDKGHAMVSSPREMRVVMAFLAKRLHLSDTSSQGLEQRDDIIELQG
jgi:predicted esterase